MSDDHQSGATVGGGAESSVGPSWLDRDEYPFESHYIDTNQGRIHYADEGEGRPLVMLHGNPTWSFVYRHIIDGLSNSYRCIAPDYLGFGLSEKPRGWPYRPRDHARVIETFIDEFEVTEVTLFVHDWGGPIGMDYATNHPDAVDSFVVMNTVMWPLTDALHVQAFSRAMGTPVARYLNRRYNVPVDWIIPWWVSDHSKLTETVHRHYREPLADPEDRRGALAFARELIGSTPWLAELWDRRERVAGKPALICWGMRGPIFRAQALGRWQALFPAADTVKYPDAGHFVEEERGEEMVPVVRDFLDERGG